MAAASLIRKNLDWLGKLGVLLTPAEPALDLPLPELRKTLISGQLLKLPDFTSDLTPSKRVLQRGLSIPQSAEMRSCNYDLMGGRECHDPKSATFGSTRQVWQSCVGNLLTPARYNAIGPAASCRAGPLKTTTTKRHRVLIRTASALRGAAISLTGIHILNRVHAFISSANWYVVSCAPELH